MEVGAGRVGGAVEAVVVCECGGTASGRARVGRHELVAVLVAAVAAAYSLVAVATLVTWLESPATK